jgi:hypothetical protein
LNESATVSGGAGSAIDLQAIQNICINCSVVTPSAVLMSNGAPITLLANPSGAATGFSRAIQTNSATFDAGGGDITHDRDRRQQRPQRHRHPDDEHVAQDDRPAASLSPAPAAVSAAAASRS